MSWKTECLADSPRAVYDADDASGSSWPDASTNGHDATITGASIVTASPPGNFAQFLDYDGVDDLTSHTDLGTFGQNLSACTIEAIIQRTSTDTGFLLGLFNGSGQTDTGIQVGLNMNQNEAQTTDSLRVYVRDGGANWGLGGAAAGALSADWLHLVLRIDGASAAITIRVNKVDQPFVKKFGELSAVTDFASFAYPLVAGARNSFGTFGNYADVRIAGLAFFPTLLSDARLDAHYDAAFGVVTEGAVVRTTGGFLRTASGILRPA